MPSINAIKLQSRALKSYPYFATYKSLSNSLVAKPNKKVYIQNLKQKGYIFNYVLDFHRLDYNSFQRGNTEGTNSLLRDWDGRKIPAADSYVVVDSALLDKQVQPSWQLVYKTPNGKIYYIPGDKKNLD